MTAQSNSKPTPTWDAFLQNPTTLLILTVTYIALTVIGILTADTTALFFPIYNVAIFSMFIASPILILSLPMSMRNRSIALLIMTMIIMPMIGLFNNYYLELAIQICIFAGLALGLNIVVGFAGLLDLGFVAFFAVGAYTWGMFTSNTDTIFTINGWTVNGNLFYLFIFFGVGAAALFGIVLGLPVLRLRGDYLAIVTLGFGEVIRLIARNLDSPTNFTNGSQGLSGILKPDIPNLEGVTAEVARIFSLRINNPGATGDLLLIYFLALVILVAIIGISYRLENSPIGRAWTAIREDEVAAIAMGVPLVRMKLMAFATGAAFGGAIGVLYAAKQSFIDPSSFQLLSSISILSMVIIGGMGNIIGVVFGAMIVTLLDLHVLSMLSQQINALKVRDFVLLGFNFRDWPSQLELAKFQPLIFGAILVLMMLFRPAGLLPARRRQLELMAEKEDASIGLEPDPEDKVK